MISEDNLKKIYAFKELFIKKYCGLEFTNSQQEASNRIIKATLEANGEIIPMEFSRQCLDSDTLIMLTDSSVKKIKDIKVGDSIFSYNEITKEIEPDIVINKWFSGIKETINIKSINELNCTNEHLFYRRNGYNRGSFNKYNYSWVKAKELKSDYKKGFNIIWLTSPSKLVINNNDFFGKERCKLLGYMLTDGSFRNPKQSMKFTNTNRKYINEVKKIVIKEFGIKPKEYIKGNGWDLILTNRSHSTNSNPFRNWIKGLPNYLDWKLSDEELKLLINRLFSGDGHCSTWIKNGYYSIELSLIEMDDLFLKWLQLQLIRFGVISYVYEIKNEKKQKSRYFKLKINNCNSIKNFFNNIGLIYGKVIACDNALRIIKKRKKFNVYEQNNLILQPLKRITNNGLKPTYDIETKKNHNFFANGLLVHNSGKTSCVCGTVSFLLVNYHRLMRELGKPTTNKFQVVLAAPIHDQVTTDFDRIKEYLDNVLKAGLMPPFETYNGNTLRFGNSEAYCFSSSPTSHPESKTANLLIIEEAQDCDDIKLNKAFFPMLANTAGPAVYIGTAGYSRCEYLKYINRGNGVIMPYDKVIEERKKAYELTKNPLLLNYEKHCQSRIEALGFDNDEFKTQYRLIWVLERGQFITEEQLYRLKGVHEQGVMPSNVKLVAGIDWGKVVDSTVVTIIDEKLRIIDWLEMQGDNYDSQMDDLVTFLKKYNPVRVYCDATSTQDMIVDWLRKRLNDIRMRSVVEGVNFTSSSKDSMFKLLVKTMITKTDEKGKLIINNLVSYPKTDSIYRRRFFNQLIELEKEEQNNVIKWHHPDKPNAHDDYVASLACALLAIQDLNKNFVKMVSYGDNTDFSDLVFERKPY